MIGKTISHYEILSKLGAGGMGVVYTARDIKLDRIVAIKFLPPSAANNPEDKERFIREAKSASALDHQNICTIFEIGETDEGQLFTAMALYEGESLEDRIERGPVPQEEACEIVRQIARGLSAAHEAGIVHRDIKPANIILTSKGVAKILDFGIAKLGEGGNLTGTGVTIGTMIYMSPEQARGDDVDHRSDIWSLGALFYELLSGSRPFSAGYDAALLYSILNQDPEPIETLVEGLPEEVRKAVHKCLEKDRDLRYENATELADTLPGAGATIIVDRVEVEAKPSRTIIQYAGVAAVGAAVVYGAMMGLGLPDWVFPVGLLLLLAGFPALLLSSSLDKRRAKMDTGELREATGMIKWLTQRRAMQGGMVAMSAFGAATAVYMALRAFGIGEFATLLTAGVIDEFDTIIVAEFENLSEEAGLGKTVSTAFKMDLGESTAITVMARSTEMDMLAYMERDRNLAVTEDVAMEMAERHGAKAIVTGELGKIGDSYQLSVQLISTETGAPLVQLRENASDAADLVGAIDRLTKSMRYEIGESLKTIRLSPIFEVVTSSSLEAIRMFNVGTELMMQARNAEAEAAFAEAVALDSTFGMAWHDRAAVVLNSGGELPIAMSYFVKANDMRDHLSLKERLQVSAAYSFMIEADPQAAVAALEAVLQEYPNDIRTLQNLANSYAQSGRLEPAVELERRAIEVAPYSITVFRNLYISLLNLGRTDEVVELIDETSAVFPDHDQVARMRALFDLESENFERAIQQADSVSVVAKEIRIESDARRITIDALLRQGRLEEAKNSSDALIRRSLAVGDSISANFFGIDAILQALIAHGDAAIARAALSSHLDRFPNGLELEGPNPVHTLAALYLEMGDLERTERYITEFRPISLWEIMYFPTNEARFNALIDPSDASIDNLIQLSVNGPYLKCGSDDVATTLDRLGRQAEAIEWYEKYISTGFGDTGCRTLETPARFRLGELYEEADSLDKAVEHYTRFAELWQDADDILQPRVTEAERRIESLLDRMTREPSQ